MSVQGCAWHPDASWERLRGGASGAGAWYADLAGRPAVVKRLVAPQRGDPPDSARPDRATYWRREADVALDGALAGASGVRAPEALRVDEDDAGITVWSERVSVGEPNGLFLARALGVFASNDLPDQPWAARSLLADRLARVEESGGWRTLARTTLADVTDRLWQRRGHQLSRLAALPQVPVHGDATPANLAGRVGEHVVGLDWASYGTGAVGADLGYLSLSVREDLDVLLEAYAAGLVSGGLPVDPDDVRSGATIVACYTALTRTEWALARVATAPGALAGKYRHPAVAPYIRRLQRLFPQLESLL